MGETTPQKSLVSRALAWLAHPVSLAAIAVMVVNDHVLKQEFGTWWTGKLSDVAGLVFFPAVVAVALATVTQVARGVAVTGRPALASPTDASRLVAIASAVTCVGFVWVKATVGGAATASAVLTAIAGPSVVRYDVTDLLALPALGVAAWVGLGAVRARQHRRAVAVAILPLAVFASVATTSGEDEILPTQGMVTNETGRWLAHLENVYGYEGSAYYTYTADGWEVYFEGASDEEWPYDRVYYVPQIEDRVPSDPSVWFRARTLSTGVDRSDDNGKTWETDWALTSEEAVILSDAYGVPNTDFVTTSVGVIETPDGYVVVAFNGTDGFAVRNTDGIWERKGFEGMACCESQKIVNFDTFGDLTPVGAVVGGGFWGLLLAALTLPVLGLGLRRGLGIRFEGDASGWGGFAYVVGALAAGQAVRMYGNYAPLQRVGRHSGDAMIVFLVIVCIAGALRAAASYGLLGPGTERETVVGSLIGAVVAASAALATTGGVWVQAAVATLAIAAFYAVYVPWVRGRRLERPSPGPRPL